MRGSFMGQATGRGRGQARENVALQSGCRKVGMGVGREVADARFGTCRHILKNLIAMFNEILI
jgi:hypothetical protein